jgi:hypothetical protein
MKLHKIALLLGLLIASTAAFAQYDDDETVQSRKTTHKREKVTAAPSADTRKMKKEDNFKSSVNKTTHLSKKEQAKLQAKKEKEHQKRFEENRERMQNKQTLNRMKKNEKYSYRYNSAKGKSWSSRNHDNATSKANKKRSKALEKRQDEAREKYENNDYQPGERKTTKKGKIREFYNPFKRDY